MAKLFSLSLKKTKVSANVLMTSLTKTPICHVCFQKRQVELLDIYLETLMCSRCYQSLEVCFKRSKISGVRVTNIYYYNDALKGLLFTFKGHGDIVLKDVFLERHLYYLKLKYFDYYLLPAPSTKESDSLRGFNHVEEIFKSLKRPFIKAVTKKENFKQSDLSTDERNKVIAKLEVVNGFELTNKKILIVDDIKTTGATLEAIIKLVKPYKPKCLEVLTVAATKTLRDDRQKTRNTK